MAMYNAGTILEINRSKNGKYKITQLREEKDGKLPPVNEIESRTEFTWSLGPIKLTGYLDTNTLEIGVVVSVMGIDLGTFYGNLKEGVGISINLLAAKGEITFYLKNGDELWVHADVKILFDGSYGDDILLISF